MDEFTLSCATCRHWDRFDYDGATKGMCKKLGLWAGHQLEERTTEHKQFHATGVCTDHDFVCKFVEPDADYEGGTGLIEITGLDDLEDAAAREVLDWFNAHPGSIPIDDEDDDELRLEDDLGPSDSQ